VSDRLIQLKVIVTMLVSLSWGTTTLFTSNTN